MTSADIRKRYKEETGKDAIITKTDGVHQTEIVSPSFDYATWLESEHARLTAELSALKGEGKDVHSVTFWLVNILRYLDDEKMRQLLDQIVARLPPLPGEEKGMKK